MHHVYEGVKCDLNAEATQPQILTLDSFIIASLQMLNECS